MPLQNRNIKYAECQPCREELNIRYPMIYRCFQCGRGTCANHAFIILSEDPTERKNRCTRCLQEALAPRREE